MGGLMSVIRIAALILIAGTIAAQQPPAPPAPAGQPPAAVPLVLENYKPATADRLKKPEDSDWLMVRRTYDGWGYSPLEQITTKNVQRLLPVWEFSTGMVSGHDSTPRLERSSGGPSPCPRRESRAAKPGRRAINGRMAEDPFG